LLFRYGRAAPEAGQRSARRATFTLFNDSSPASGPAFSAFFHSTHSAFSLSANAEAGTADHDTDTRRRRPFLNNSASFRGWLLDDVVIRKARRDNESCQGGTGQNCSHEKSPFEFANDFASTRMKLLGSSYLPDGAPISRKQLQSHGDHRDGWLHGDANFRYCCKRQLIEGAKPQGQMFMDLARIEVLEARNRFIVVGSSGILKLRTMHVSGAEGGRPDLQP
jgi:hypothetical protein